MKSRKQSRIDKFHPKLYIYFLKILVLISINYGSLNRGR